jgi:hypothetical protein
MLQQSYGAQWASLTGDNVQANTTLSVLCSLDGDKFQQDSSFGDAQQRDIALKACTMQIYLENGLDIFGQGSQEVYPIAWTNYRSQLDSFLDIMRDEEDKVEDTKQELRFIQLKLGAAQMSDVIIREIQDAEASILQNMEDEFDRIDGSLGRLDDAVVRQEAQLRENNEYMKVRGMLLFLCAHE